eukprot:scaffold10141_cov146-Amphora_coffeaeformis.AAC.2
MGGCGSGVSDGMKIFHVTEAKTGYLILRWLEWNFKPTSYVTGTSAGYRMNGRQRRPKDHRCLLRQCGKKSRTGGLFVDIENNI